MAEIEENKMLPNDEKEEEFVDLLVAWYLRRKKKSKDITK